MTNNGSKNRGCLNAQEGIDIVESIIVNEFDWAFHEQNILDDGMDMYIAQKINGNSTGKFISLQVKTDPSYLEENADGNFNFGKAEGLDEVHLQYWLASPTPVILVLWDTHKKVAYWAHIMKRNLVKTNRGSKNIIVSKKSILNGDSVKDFEKIINGYTPKNLLDDNIENMSVEESESYSTELLIGCVASSQSMVRSLEIYMRKNTIVRDVKSLKPILDSGEITRKDFKKGLRTIGDNNVLNVNMFTKYIQKEKALILEPYIKVFVYLDKHLITQEDDLYAFNDVFVVALLGTRSTIINVIECVSGISDGFTKSRLDLGKKFKNAEDSCLIMIDAYLVELKSLCKLMDKYASALS